MLLDSNFLSFLEKLRLIMEKPRHTLSIGHHSGQRPGSGLDFKDYRPYQRGDDFRYIDWNLFSRFEQFYMKEFAEERNFLVYFLIDCSSSMGFGTPTKLQYALRLAAALGYIALASDDQVGVALYTTLLENELKPVKGKKQTWRLFQYLEQATAKGKTDLNHCLSTFALKAKQPGLAIILSDLLEDEICEVGLKSLRAKGWEVWLLQILTPWENKPTLKQHLRLIDVETKKSKEVLNPDEAVACYLENLHLLQTKLKKLAITYGCRFLSLSTSQPLEELFFQTMRQERLIV